MININSKTNIYKEIEMLAKMRKVTISELCRRSGVPRHSITRWKNKNPFTVEQIQKIINQLEIIPTKTEENE